MNKIRYNKDMNIYNEIVHPYNTIDPLTITLLFIKGYLAAKTDKIWVAKLSTDGGPDSMILEAVLHRHDGIKIIKTRDMKDVPSGIYFGILAKDLDEGLKHE